MTNADNEMTFRLTIINHIIGRIRTILFVLLTLVCVIFISSDLVLSISVTFDGGTLGTVTVTTPTTTFTPSGRSDPREHYTPPTRYKERDWNPEVRAQREAIDLKEVFAPIAQLFQSIGDAITATTQPIVDFTKRIQANWERKLEVARLREKKLERIKTEAKAYRDRRYERLYLGSQSMKKWPAEIILSPPVKRMYTPPMIPLYGQLIRLTGFRGRLTQKEAEDWLDVVGPALSKISAPFDYVDEELLGVWVIWDWATDPPVPVDSISDCFGRKFKECLPPFATDMWELWFRHHTIPGPNGPIRADGLGITNLRPADLLEDTQAASRLISNNKVPEEIKQLAREANRSEERYRELMYKDKRFSLYVLGSTMQVLHERLRKVESEMRTRGELGNVQLSSEHYEQLVNYAIEHNRGTIAEIETVLKDMKGIPSSLEGLGDIKWFYAKEK
ncbi:MAG: hypothetical protein HQ551_07855 [Desulfobacteraceae bacterium]|nr:hypothetical protein [Desulfobacteraceae bacterium]